MSLIDKEQFINEMNTRAEEEVLDFVDIRDMVEFAPTVKAVPLDKVKQARKELQNLVDMCGSDTLAELDKKAALQAALLSIVVLIEESEGNNG